MEKTLFVSTLNLQEVLHVIEKWEFDRYRRNNNPNIKLKRYRQNQSGRLKLKYKLDFILQQIEQAYSIEEDAITKEEIRKFVSAFENHVYDPIDFFAAHSKCEAGCFNYITDDSDFKNNFKFQTESDIHLYTYDT
ncbi:hypothetical protein [Methanolapillus ohkumae]|uniref:Uncharacterized protein n=1 Tax=Methanolapillus ohkumae TaxID=3028298 RepID=A0AA96V6C8_9EURY|nr:hypothetical protein MsAm2_05320 [Methanosarcinaceae archaeon Am2]